MKGLDPLAVGTELRLGRIGRENVATKARRLLVEGRIQVRRVDDRGVLADVRGDSGIIRRVLFDPHAETWSCDCEARGRCSHIQAAASVVAVTVAREPEEAKGR